MLIRSGVNGIRGTGFNAADGDLYLYNENDANVMIELDLPIYRTVKYDDVDSPVDVPKDKRYFFYYWIEYG